MSEMKMQRILAAVDLGPQSEDLLAWAGWFARLFRANVEVVHALSIGLPPYFTQAQTETLVAQLGKERGIVGERIKQLASKASRDVSFTVNVVDGPALQVIRAVVQEDKPDLLVIGSQGHGRLQRMLLGSVAENLFREAHCPTLIVKSKLPEAGPRRMLCPVNFSEIALECARFSSRLAEKAGADLFLLQAVEEAEADADAVKDRLCQWHREGGVVHPRVVEIVRRGDPTRETVTESQRHGIDLIVVGAQHRRLLDSLAIGRTTEHIVRVSPISVLVVPAGVDQADRPAQGKTATG